MARLPRPDDLSQRDRRIVFYLLGIVALVCSLTVTYNYGMRVLEGRPQSLYRSLTAVVETMTTTGYGSDAPWETPAMNLFMVFVQITGIALGFVTLRLVIIPLFTRAEVDLDERLPPKRDHVVVCEYQRDPAVLLDELAENGVEYVLLSPHEETARTLSDTGYDAIRGSTQEPDAYRRASLNTARAVLIDADEATVDTILTVRSLRPDVEVVALTDDSDLRSVLASVGADSVLSPYAAVGQRLGEKAVASFGSTLGDAVGGGPATARTSGGTDDAVELGADVEVVERLVPHDSPLVGQSLRESRLGERSGATVVGAWIDGQLRLPPDPNVELRPNTVLVVLGRSTAIEALAELTRPARTRGDHDRVVILGAGEVGLAAREVLVEAGVDVVTVDTDDGDLVDVVGDATVPETLRAAGVADAEAALVCLPTDATALLATALVRQTAPDAEVLVRVNDTDATGKALTAGADYVLSVPRVSARMVVAELRGEEVVEPASQMRLARVGAAPFAGQTLADSGIYEATGCRVIAVEGDRGVVAPVAPDRTFAADEQLTVVGTDATVRTFLERFDLSEG